MAIMTLPIGGDVSQFIAPWSWFVRQAGQLGLVNISIGSTPAPDVEAKVLEDVGSYGRQIGQIGDALRVVLELLNLSQLTPEQRRAIDALNDQLIEIDKLKARRGREAEATVAELD